MNDSLDAQLDRRALDSPAVRQALDRLTIVEVESDLGQPERTTKYLEPLIWKPGMDRPSMGSEDPAVTIAMAKCAITRQQSIGIPGPAVDSFHPDTCAWCDYPTDQLLLAVDWGNWHARYITSEMLVWRQSQTGPGRGVTYMREGRKAGYSNPAWRDFDALSAHEQRRRVRAVSEAIPGG